MADPLAPGDLSLSAFLDEALNIRLGLLIYASNPSCFRASSTLSCSCARWPAVVRLLVRTSTLNVLAGLENQIISILDLLKVMVYSVNYFIGAII